MGIIGDEKLRCARLTDDELWAAVPELARGERAELARFLIHLGEVYKRELHIRKAYSNLYFYLYKLGFSEWESRARAIAAVAALKYRSILSLLRSGRLQVSAVAMLGKHLNSENHRTLLRKACRRTNRELQALIAGLDPAAPRRDVMRVIAAPTPLAPVIAAIDSVAATASTQPCAAMTADASRSAEARPTEPIGPAAAPPNDLLLLEMDVAAPPETAPPSRRLRFSFDGPEELADLIGRARDILSHKYPYGEMECILLDAVNALLDRIDPERRFKRRVERARVRGREMKRSSLTRGLPA